MSEISELGNLPEVSFIENLTLSETEEMLTEHYRRIFREKTGGSPDLTDSDEVTLLIKAFSLILYQVMQYIETKGRQELLATATGGALDHLAALFGVSRQSAGYAEGRVRFTLGTPREEATAIPEGTRVKTPSGVYFATVEYGEAAAGESFVEILCRAEEAGAVSVPAGEISVLVDPIPYVAAVENPLAVRGGTEEESDDSLTSRIYLSPSKFSCAGPKDAYEYYVREWRSDVEDVVVTSPEPCRVEILVVLSGGVLPDEEQRQSLEEYLSPDDRRPLGDRVTVISPEEISYDVDLTYYIAASDAKSAAVIQENVSRAMEEYEAWQRKLGRDINPTELIAKLREAGVKRVELAKPAHRVIGKTQMPKPREKTVKYGGLEDD